MVVKGEGGRESAESGGVKCPTGSGTGRGVVAGGFGLATLPVVEKDSAIRA